MYGCHECVCHSPKAVQSRSEKIAEDEQKCLQLAEAAQKDLNEALPALDQAMEVSIAPPHMGICSMHSHIVGY